MPATVDTGSRVNGVTWYEVHTMRKADSKGTLVRVECFFRLRQSQSDCLSENSRRFFNSFSCFALVGKERAGGKRVCGGIFLIPAVFSLLGLQGLVALSGVISLSPQAAGTTNARCQRASCFGVSAILPFGTTSMPLDEAFQTPSTLSGVL